MNDYNPNNPMPMPEPSPVPNNTQPGYDSYYAPPGYPNGIPTYPSPYPAYYNYSPYAPGYAYPPFADARQMVKASFGQRLLSLFLDCVFYSIFSIVATFVFYILGIIVFLIFYSSSSSSTSRSSVGDGLLLIVLIAGGASLILLIGQATLFLVTMSKGQSLGNKVAGLRYVSATGQKPGFARAFGRLVIVCISIIALPLTSSNIYAYSYTSSSGYSTYQKYFSTGWLIAFAVVALWLIMAQLWSIWDKNKQSLYDKILGTYAISTRPF